ncbi:unnamed protein product, partial [Staurois parvus]
ATVPVANQRRGGGAAERSRRCGQVTGAAGGRNSATSLVSVGGGIVPHRWCQWGEE